MLSLSKHDRTRAVMSLSPCLPEHIVPEFLRFGALCGQCCKLAVEDFVGMGFFVILKGVPIGHDCIMVVRGPGFTQRPFG